MNIKNKLVDDGFCPKLVDGAEFDGIFEIPKIPAQEGFKLPKWLCPYSKAKQEFGYDTFLMFYEFDVRFREIFTNLESLNKELDRFEGVVSPDCSLYFDMPLATQIANTYLNRAFGYHLFRKGHHVVPNIRWGDERSYATCLFPEPFAFQGVAKHSVVAVGNYGCFKSPLEKFHFVRGFKEMMEYLEPTDILFYGCLPPKIFNAFTHKANIVHYDNWTKVKHSGERR